MRVMCINDRWTTPGDYKFPKYGDVNQVVGNHYSCGHLYYFLDGYGMFDAYDADHFIPLQSDTAPEIEIEQLQPTHA